MKPIFVAIDTPDLDRALSLADAVRALAGGVKLGLEFFCSNGPDGVREIASTRLPIFLDLKLHDIPNTVAKAVQALRPLEPAVLTVHASGGRAMDSLERQQLDRPQEDLAQMPDPGPRRLRLARGVGQFLLHGSRPCSDRLLWLLADPAAGRLPGPSVYDRASMCPL